MEAIGAFVAAVFTLASSIVFVPQEVASNVLGLFDSAQTSTDAVTEVVTDEVTTAGDSAGTTRTDRRANAAAARQESRANAAEIRAQARADREALRAEAAEKRAAAREEAKDNRAEAKARIAQIRDERKRAVADRVCTKFESLNGNITARYTERLGRLTELLGKVESRAAKANERGRDTSSCTDAINTASAAIAAAQDAVNDQAGNTYVCEIVDDASLGSSLSTTRKALGDDLKSMRSQVKQSHSAVKLALRCLRGVKDIDLE